MANHRDGGRDPTELELTVQPANTARPVGRHTRGKYPSQPVMGGSWAAATDQQEVVGGDFGLHAKPYVQPPSLTLGEIVIRFLAMTYPIARVAHFGACGCMTSRCAW